MFYSGVIPASMWPATVDVLQRPQAAMAHGQLRGRTRRHGGGTLSLWHCRLVATLGERSCKMSPMSFRSHCMKILRSKQNGHHFLNNIFKFILLNENVRISIKI